MNKFKLMLASMLIISQFGLGILYLLEHNYKTFGLGILYAIANVIIFIL